MKPNMKTTIIEDNMGSLHIFKGWVEPFKKGAYLYTVDGREADLFIQEGMGVEEFKESTSLDKGSRAKALRGGWAVRTRIDSLYFQE